MSVMDSEDTGPKTDRQTVSRSRAESETATERPVPLQTGREEFDLGDEWGRVIGTIELVLRIDSVSMWMGNRTLMVIDRDVFREWLIHPVRCPLESDDVVWFMDEDATCLRIDAAMSFTVPDEVIRRLAAVM